MVFSRLCIFNPKRISDSYIARVYELHYKSFIAQKCCELQSAVSSETVGHWLFSFWNKGFWQRCIRWENGQFYHEDRLDWHHTKKTHDISDLGMNKSVCCPFSILEKNCREVHIDHCAVAPSTTMFYTIKESWKDNEKELESRNNNNNKLHFA